jgi:hypothetical protein
MDREPKTEHFDEYGSVGGIWVCRWNMGLSVEYGSVGGMYHGACGTPAIVRCLLPSLQGLWDRTGPKYLFALLDQLFLLDGARARFWQIWRCHCRDATERLGACVVKAI